MIELFQRSIFEENLALSFFLGMCTCLLTNASTGALSVTGRRVWVAIA